MQARHRKEKVRIIRQGNYLLLTLPESTIEALALREGQEVEIGMNDRGRFEVDCTIDPPAPLKLLRQFRGLLAGSSTTEGASS
ncbi:hypothetical protein DR64_7517 [Paraburkholderia xenovorans LB400]|uniref:SpoVT-AbrB domain-containing protein n=1 Tax=Paraburkholderia xenovorans (strain LB400) TaxID=266265 RepID=Q13GI1_PARXL|nr:hypothetical protein [Paraburkholderia xenovorans]ABE36808.1 hypothetical protein Bxe_C0933 [Paraburkholderia xenovorans LB400]AIP33948.1 hypothetical protein DR64_7517 [Paraburkholderia xenovorans LB400]